MLPTIDFTQQLSQIQAQLQSMKPTYPQATGEPNACAFRLPCGLCSKTNAFCGMNTTEEKKDE